MKNGWIAFCIIFSILLPACNYDPDDEYNADLKPVEAPPASLTIADYDSIIKLATTTSCLFEFAPERALSIKKILVYIDGHQKFTLGPGDPFIINPSDYNHGEHILEIDVYTNSGSKSLADALGAEGYVYSRAWKLFIDTENPDQVIISKAISQDGRLKIYWNKYNRVNFVKYVIYRHKATIPDGTELYEKISETSNINDTVYTDSTYIGGFTKYYVNIEGYNSTSTGLPFNVNYPLPKILKTENVGSKMIVTFTKCLFESNFKEYVIYQNWQEYNTIMPPLSIIQNIQDTIVTVQGVLFNEPVTLGVATHWKGSQFTQDWRQYEPITIITTHLGDTSFTFKEADGARPFNNIYFTDGEFAKTLYSYNTTTHTCHMLREYPSELFYRDHLSVSADGNLLVYNSDFANKTELFHLPDMELLNEVSDFPSNSRVTISDNMLAPSISQGHLYLYDFSTNQYKDTITEEFFIGWSYISPDGNFLYFDSYDSQDRLYTIENGKFRKVSSFSDNSAFMGFDIQNLHELIYYSDNRVRVINLLNLTTQRTFSVESEPITNIDPVSGYFLVKTGDLFNVNCAVYDIKTGEKVTFINVYDGIFMANYILYGNRGYQLNLKEE